MKKIIAVFSFCFLHAVFALAQFTTTTATITDSDSTVWTNAQVTVSFQPNPNVPNINSYNINGIPLTSTSYVSYLQQISSTNSSGVLSITLLDNQLISPSGSSWHFVIKPNASVQAISYNPIAVTGGSFSLTSYLSSNTIAPRFPAILNAYGYTDGEVTPIPQAGGFYFNTFSTVQRIWNGTSWQNGASSGATIPATNNPLCGNGSAGVSIACTAGNQYVAPSGNVATATALAAIPSKCSPGQAPLGVDAQGNALTCQVITVGGTLILAPGAGVSQTVVQQPGTQLNLNNVTTFNMNGDNWTTNELNTVIYVDGVNGSGINVNPVAWVTATAYPWCTEVSYLGGNYIETIITGDASTIPGTNSKTWYPITNGSVPTQLDCAFYTAASTIVSGTGTVASGGIGAKIILGTASPYYTNIGLTEPTVSSPASPVVNIIGQGSSITTIKQGSNKADGLPSLTQPHATTPFAFPSFLWQGFTLDSSYNATSVIGIYGAQHFVLDDLVLADATDGSDHYIEFGDAADTAHGWVFEPIVNNVNIGAFQGFGTGSVITTTVSGGVPSFTVAIAGNNYVSADTKAVLIGTSAFGVPCSSMGTTTATIVSGHITAVTSSATGCVAPLYTIIYSGAHINYGYKLSNVSDKGHWSTMVNGGIGWIAGMYTSNITNAIEITNYHPESTLVGLQQNGSGTLINLQCDTMFQYCVDFEGAGITNLVSPSIEWNNPNMTGSRDYYFGTINGVPGFTEPQAVNIYGEDCLIPAQQPGYAHFDSNQGVIDSNVGSDIAFMPTYVHDFSAMYCNQLGNGNNVKAATPTLVGSDIQMSNGVVGNYLNWNMGANFLNGGSQTITVTAPNSTATSLLGQYNLNFSNTTPATVSHNYSGPQIGNFGTYYDGAASQPIGFYTETIPASGSNPLISFATKAGGTGSSGGEQYTWDQKIVAPNVTDSDLTSGNCVQAGTGGLLTTAGAPCGSGGANPVMTGYCTGTAPSSSGGVGLAGLGGLGTSCASGTFAIGFIMPYAATLSVLNVRCGTTGVNGSSGVFTVYDSPSGGFAQTATGLAVTYGTTTANTNVSDVTHTFSAAKGDLIQVAFSTQASETLGYCSASVEF